jgi:hypothetical protein
MHLLAHLSFHQTVHLKRSLQKFLSFTVYHGELIVRKFSYKKLIFYIHIELRILF